MRIPHSRPLIDQEDIEAVAEVLASGMIAQGEKVKEFEEAMARFVGVRHGVAVSSGTSALHLALIAIGVKAGDEVIMPSYICPSPYLAALHAGAVPKIVDIDLTDLNICGRTVKKHVSPKTKVLIVPHMFGTPAELDGLLGLGVPVIEDCAQSLGAEYKGQPVGGLGEMSITSFYATKMMTTGEGGMVLTNNSEFCSRLIEARDYDKKPLNCIRYNYKMTDFQAALGLSQLEKLPNFIERRREIASVYTSRLSEYNIDIPHVYSHKKPVFYRYVIMAENAELIQKRAKENGVTCEKPVYKPLHTSLSGSSCPNADKAHDKALSIPLYPGLSKAEIKYMLQTFDLIFAASDT